MRQIELQVRISVETAEIIEELKARYEADQQIRFTKSDVLMKAVNDNKSSWEDTKWENIEIELSKRSIAPSATRPKFDISPDVDNYLKKLKAYLPNYLGTRSVTIGVAIKYAVKLALFNFQKNDDKVFTYSEMISQIKEKYLAVATSTAEKSILNEALAEVEFNLNHNHFHI